MFPGECICKLEDYMSIEEAFATTCAIYQFKYEMAQINGNYHVVFVADNGEKICAPTGFEDPKDIKDAYRSGIEYLSDRCDWVTRKNGSIEDEYERNLFLSAARALDPKLEENPQDSHIFEVFGEIGN